MTAVRDPRAGAAPAPPPQAEPKPRLRRRPPARLLLDISNRLGASEDLAHALAILAEITTGVLQAERGSIFLNDPVTGELYSRVAEGKFSREVRILNTTGVAGHVFTTGEGVIIHDAYADSRFNRAIDAMTGYVTRNIVCAPLRTLKGEIIGVSQCLNRTGGQFDQDHLDLLEAMIEQAAVALESHRTIENIEKTRKQELDFLAVVSDMSSELNLTKLLAKIMGAITRMLDAERSTLFINDEKTKELYTVIGQGLESQQIRLPNHLGIAGAVFTSAQSVNIPYAYADLRFNPSFDRKTGFFTRSILCVPVVNKDGKTIGVTQVLNKHGGIFTEEDEARLKAFTSQISIGLENAKLFDDVQAIKNYNESVLESMSNGVVTLGADGRIVTCNAAAQRIMRTTAAQVIDHPAAEFFAEANAWVMDKVATVGKPEHDPVTMDAELAFGDQRVSANITVLPLRTPNEAKLGSMIMIEDISSEKRMKSTMSRYMDPSLADKLLQGGEDLLGGHASAATVLFSDIRSFTTLTEELGPQGTVSLLNEYFTIMVDCITDEGGMLDKFIGDAMMAVFGTPLAHDDDEDRAVRAAIRMLRELRAFNAQRAKDGKKPVDIGIGLNSDVVVSGNIGSPKRMDYTVIGDGVNLAARLESACKQYGAHLLASEYTIRRLKATYRTREIDKVVVKGKTQPVSVYEILDWHTDESFPKMAAVLHAFSFGLQAYRAAKFDEALHAFEDALGLHPGDAAAKMYVERCKVLRADPPGDEWDGVWVMKSK